MGAPNSTSLGLAITFPTLAILSVYAKFYARRLTKAKLWWDDYLLLPGLVSQMLSYLEIIATNASVVCLCDCVGHLHGSG